MKTTAKLSFLLLILLGIHMDTYAEKNGRPKVRFLAPHDGETIPANFLFKFGLEGDGWRVEPAGKLIPKTGHHHVIINKSYIGKGKIIPTDPVHIHFGKGQTEAVLPLEPGKVTLTLQFADGAHMSYGEDLSHTITVTVQKP